MELIGQIADRVLKPKICEECKSEFIPAETSEFWLKRIKLCPKCLSAAIEKENAEEAKRVLGAQLAMRAKQWNDACPPIFRDTEIEKLPCLPGYKQAMAWAYGPNGLVLHGPSGRGKSRCAWLILRREWENRLSFKVMDSMSGLKYASKFHDGANCVEEWVQGIIDTDLLFMDDIFKNKLTDSFEGSIFTIIDQRIQQRRPIILTSNDTGTTLAARMTEDRAEPMIRRIREHSTTITFA